MKIGIITHFWVSNFGANLQAVSTFRYLKSLGHEPIMLNYRPHDLEMHNMRFFKSAQIEQHEQFVQDHLKISPVMRNDSDLIKYSNKMRFDVILAGSDSIMRVKNSVKSEDGKFPNSFWLKWTEKLEIKPRTCFLAASTEGSYYFFLKRNTQMGIKSALESVDYVSVRDRWSQKMVDYVSRGIVMSDICPDPVSILNSVLDVSENHAGASLDLKKKYVLLSVSKKYLSSTWVKQFRNMLKKRGLKFYTLPTPGREFEFEADEVLRTPMHPLTWYSWIANARAIITSQFHPIACATFNSVPFISVDISGQMYFRSFGIRSTSKAHDLCMNINAESNSVLPMRARFLLSPQKAMDLIDAWNIEAVVKYQQEAKDSFGSTIKKVLNEVGEV